MAGWEAPATARQPLGALQASESASCSQAGHQRHPSHLLATPGSDRSSALLSAQALLFGACLSSHSTRLAHCPLQHAWCRVHASIRRDLNTTNTESDA